MIALIQRVIKASVFVSNKEISNINKGLLILLGIKNNDSIKDIDYLVSKICSLKIFENSSNKLEHFSKSIIEQKFEILVVSQFTLYANLKKGSKPSFTDAMNGEDAKQLYLNFINKLKTEGLKVKTGEFGAMMKIELINDGPVTLNLTSDHLKVKNI